MTTATPAVQPPPWSRIAKRVWFEVYLGWRYIAGDIPAAVLPGIAFALAAARYADLTWPQLAVVAAKSLLLFWLYAYTFCSSNQARAGDEDRINKPYRAIPSGLVTPRGTLTRYWIAMAVYTLLGIWFGVWPWVLAWQANTFVLNFLFGRNWLVKAASMVTGAIFQLAAAWQLAAPLDTTTWRWIVVSMLLAVLGGVSEDLRDIEGDRSVGRTRLVLLVGHWPVRIFTALIYMATPVVCHVILYAPTGSPLPVVLICDAALASLSWLAAFRVLTIRDFGRGDHITYMIYTYSYTIVPACGIAVF